ncbi:glycosyl transferase, partial [Enterococcus faecalis]|nr:glycosyl transferase [Enterococcus faecalis]
MNICIVSPSLGYGGSNIIAATLGKELNKNHNLVYYSYKYTDNYSNLPEEKIYFFKGRHSKLLDKLKKGTEYIFSGGKFTPYKYYKGEIN